MQVDFYKIHTF